MGRRRRWRRILQGGVGTSGLMAAFLLGMAAAILLKLISAGGEIDSGGSYAGYGANRAETGAWIRNGPPLAKNEKADRADVTRPAEEQDGVGTAGSGKRSGGASGQGGAAQQAKDGSAHWWEDGLAQRAEDGSVQQWEHGAAQRGEYGSAEGAEDGAFGQAGPRDEPLVRVYLADERRVERVPLETYVRGVVAGEMPADFELEALKAQAIAARTYIVRRLAAGGRNGGDDRDYDVTDGEADQVYVPLERMRQWERERAADMRRIERAVAETEGLVLVYGGEPIEAAYFSTSGGYTENAEDYWSVAVPYLRSVPSPWDAQLSPEFEREIGMELDEFYERLGIGKRDRKGGIEVLSRTEGRSVKEIRIGKRILTGREVREALDLPSANFSIRVRDGRITLICRGHGHGVGMSQWGAQALALAGNDAEQILAYYYRGARLLPSASLAEPSESFKT